MSQTLAFSTGHCVAPPIPPWRYIALLKTFCAQYTIVFAGDLPYPRERKFFELLLAGVGATCKRTISHDVDVVITTTTLASERDIDTVRAALDRGIMIVSYRWLDDMVVNLLPYKPWQYSIPQHLIRIMNRMTLAPALKQEAANFVRGCQLAHKDMNGTDIYHLYRAMDGFQYDVALTRFRTDLNETEMIQLRVYEHHVSGTLWTVATFNLPHPTRSLEFTISHTGCATLPFMAPFEFFEYIFKAATGYSWKWRPWGFRAEMAGIEGPSPGLKIEAPLACIFQMDKGKEHDVVCNVPAVTKIEYFAMGRGRWKMEDGFQYERPSDVDGVTDWVKREGRARWGPPPRRIGEGGVAIN